MRRMNIVVGIFMNMALATMLLCGTAGSTEAASGKGKPMIPVQVAIEPTVAKMKPQNIKPGDVVEFKVSARAPRGAEEMTIEITLLDGAELVSGDLKWSGKVSRNEAKQLVISVRAPAKGTGRVMASVLVLREGRTTVAKQMIYTLGTAVADGSGKPAPKMRRDSKGREVLEY